MGRPKKITPEVEKAPERLPGSFDVLPEQYYSWEFFGETLNSLSHTFGYAKIQTPTFEDAKLYKFWQQSHPNQLVTTQDKKGAVVAAKPIHLFGLGRAYLEYHFFEREKVSKWFYQGQVSKINAQNHIEQGYEFGFQIFGEINPIADAQMINLALRIFTELGLNNLSLEINNIGCLECLPGYQEVLKNYFKDKKYDLCDNCLESLETNPVKILECNNLSCSTVASEAPPLVDYLCDNCHKHFIGVLEGLDELSIAYNLNPKIIRYRNEQQDIVLVSGGHVDDLIQSLGGAQVSGLGFSGTFETVMTALELAQIKYSSKNKVDVYLIPLGDLAAKKSLKLFTELWNQNIVASEFLGSGSIKNQLKLAEANRVEIALIIGQKEAREATVILRDVRSGMQELFTTDRIVDEVKKRLGK